MERVRQGLEYLANLRKFKREDGSNQPEVIHPNQVIRVGRMRWTKRNIIAMGMIGLTAGVAGFFIQRFIRKDRKF